MKTKNNKQTTYYIIPPTASDERANECEHVFNALIDKHENWQRFDAGWTHEHMMASYRFTALYGSPDEPHAMLTIGCMNDKLMLKARFMQYDSEKLDSPDDMDMFMPFEFTNPDDKTGVNALNAKPFSYDVYMNASFAANDWTTDISTINTGLYGDKAFIIQDGSNGSSIF